MQQVAVPGAEPDDFVFERQRVENRLDFFGSFCIKTKRTRLEQ